MTLRHTMVATATVAVFFALSASFAGASAPTGGPGEVELTDGRTIQVAALRQGADGLATLELRSGGAMVLPASVVARWIPLGDTGTEVAPPIVPAVTAAAAPAWVREAGDYAALIEAAAARNRLHPELLAAVARVESGFDATAVSPKGAAGVLQLMPETAARFGARDRFDPAQNVEAGARYLSWLLDRFGNRLDLALAGYNAGEHAVDRYAGVPPYRETLFYVHRVMRHASRYGLPTRPVR